MKKPGALRVCLAQINVTVGDLEGNAGRIEAAAREAKKAGADLSVFPELALTGYPLEDLLFQRDFVSHNLSALAKLAKRLPKLTAVVGFVDRDRAGRLYNAAAVIRGGSSQYKVYRKCELPNYGVFDEKRYFLPGGEGLIVDIAGHRVALSICEDIWVPTSWLYFLPKRRVDALVNISASPYQAGKHGLRIKIASRLAKRLGAPVVYSNLVGGQDELVFDGGSFAADASGRVKAQAPRFEEASVSFELKKGRVSASGERIGELGAEEEVYRALVLGTRDYVEKNGFRRVAVGLSGGIDSALVAAIAVDAFGASSVRGVTMPSPYTSDETLADAKRLAKNLGIELIEIGISGVFDSFLRALKGAFAGAEPNVAEENLQARIRGTLLMALSNKFGDLVLTTGNKSEMATGYCTLYGDMAGAFAPIKDVPKTLVYRLARWRNRVCPGGIPAETLRRAPTAELCHNQKDQDTLPPYPALDAFLKRFIEAGEGCGSAAPKGMPAAAAKRVAKMVYSSEYKRRQAPPGVKITPLAFGRDRRMPITNRYSP